MLLLSVLCATPRSATFKGFHGDDPPHKEKKTWLLVEWPEEEKEPTKYFFCDLPVSLSKSVERSYVCTYLIGIGGIGVTPPLLSSF
jgi:hypothetical protein